MPVGKAYNKKHAKEHFGHHSDRRNARNGYSNDSEGRFTYKGVVVNNAGYSKRRFVNIKKENEEFGPGEP